MAKIFISYRRMDSAAISGRIYDRLVARFRRRNMFKDVDDIPAGVDFGSYIQQSVRACAVMLVVIGPHWLDTRRSDGERRLDDPRDWVRVEIETALSFGLTIIPLLVEDATIPAAADLPESLRALPRLNALPVRNDPDFAHDMERVVHAIERIIATSRLTPGIFRRGVASRPTPQQSMLEQSAPLAQPDLTPAEPLQAPPPVTPPAATADQMPLSSPRQVPTTYGWKRARSAVLVVVAAVLIVTSLSVLFNQGIIPGTAGGRTNHPPTPTKTTALLTATTMAVTLPLTVHLPGPEQCANASGTGWAKPDWVASSQDSYDCSDGRATRIYPDPCDAGSCKYSGGIDFVIQNAGITLPQAYTIGVTLSRLTAESYGQLHAQIQSDLTLESATGDVLYDFNAFNSPAEKNSFIAIDGIQTAKYCSTNPCGRSLDTNKPNMLAFHIIGKTVTALLNGAVFASLSSVSPLPPISKVGFHVSVTLFAYSDQVSFTYVSHRYHADFSNFTITPL